MLSYLAFASVGLMWGINFLFMKMTAPVLSPIQVVWCRVIFGTFPILLIALARRSLRWIDLKQSHHFLVLALLSNVLPFYFLTKGTQFLKSGIAGVLAGSVPLMTAILAFFFLPSDKIGFRKCLGLGIGFAGIALVAEFQKSLSGSLGGELYGVGYMFLAVLSFALVVIYSKRVLAPLNLTAIQTACYPTLIASLIMTCITPIEGLDALFSNPEVFFAAVVGLGFLGTGIAYILFYYIIDKLGAITASSVYYMPPVVALGAGAVFAHESISTLQGIGTLFIFAGVYFARNASSKGQDSVQALSKSSS